MKIYLIMPVRAIDTEVSGLCQDYLTKLEALGHSVHFPPRDAPQEDLLGRAICVAHYNAMRKSDEVHVIWDVESKGSHFDLGMAFSMDKKIVPVRCLRPDPPGKSYWKAIVDFDSYEYE